MIRALILGNYLHHAIMLARIAPLRGRSQNKKKNNYQIEALMAVMQTK